KYGYKNPLQGVQAPFFNENMLNLSGSDVGDCAQIVEEESNNEAEHLGNSADSGICRLWQCRSRAHCLFTTSGRHGILDIQWRSLRAASNGEAPGGEQKVLRDHGTDEDCMAQRCIGRDRQLSSVRQNRQEAIVYSGAAFWTSGSGAGLSICRAIGAA